MFLLNFASFAWGIFHGYGHARLIVVLSVSAALAIGDIFFNWKKLSQRGPKDGLGSLAGGLGLYFAAAFLSSLMSQVFGYLVGYVIRWAI